MDKKKACIAIIIALSVTKKKQIKRKRWIKEWIAKRKVLHSLKYFK